MIKYIWATCILSSFVYGQNFDQFLQNALQHSPYLQANALTALQADIEGEKLQRYANPSLDIEYSNFQINNAKNDSGYRASLSQPVRLWGITQDKKMMSDAIQQQAKAKYLLNKADFTKKLSLIYLQYLNLKYHVDLAAKEQDIAQQIYTISTERYKGGSIAKGVLLQAQVDFELVEIKHHTLLIEMEQAYTNLLLFAGLTDSIEIEEEHTFEVQQTQYLQGNPEILYTQTQNKLAYADAKLNTNKVEYLAFNFAYEKEPDRSIYRLGISLPLAVFNTKDEERKIAQLEAKKSQILLSYQEKKVLFEKKSLLKKRALLLSLKTDNRNTLKHQKKLLKMFEDAYKIAKVNFIALQTIKNKLVATQELLIQTKIALQKNAIQLNYINGAYND